MNDEDWLSYIGSKEAASSASLRKVATKRSQRASLALWVACQANISSMQNQPVVRFAYVCFRQVPHQLPLYGQGRCSVGIYQAQPF